MSVYEYAIEADPGQCTASFPTFGTLDEALIAATAPVMTKADLRPVRVLQRLRGPWTVATEGAPLVTIELEDLRMLLAEHDVNCSFCATQRGDICRDRHWITPLRILASGAKP